jgi:putative chitinase
MITAQKLRAVGVGETESSVYPLYLMSAWEKWRVESQLQRAAFLAQAIHETGGFVRVRENLNYSDPERIARIFRTAFDLDADGKIEPNEIEFAKAYVNQAEKLANRAYANRYGNRDIDSGDGWRFRGRGLFQITFRDNYRAAGLACGRDYITNPDQVARAEDAALTAAWFWSSKGCNAIMAEQGPEGFTATTRKINPGMAGAAERWTLFQLCQRVQW